MKGRTRNRAADGTRLDRRGLEPREAAFVREYLKDHNGTAAYMRAYGLTNRKSASVQACMVSKRPWVQAAIDAEEQQAAREARLTHKEILGKIKRNLDRAERNEDLPEVRKNAELLGRYRGLNMWRESVLHTGADDGPIEAVTRIEHVIVDGSKEETATPDPAD